MFSLFTPRNLVKQISRFQVEQVLFSHFSPRLHRLSAISCPTLSALLMNPFSTNCKILWIIVEIVLAKIMLLTVSTHFIVRSKIALSTLDKAPNQSFALKAFTLIFTRSCLVVKVISFLPLTLAMLVLLVIDSVSH